MVTWWLRYNPHTIEQTCSLHLGTTTWYPHVTWDGFVTYYTLWQTG